MPSLWLSRIQRWLLHPHTCPEHAWGHPHTYGGCPNLSDLGLCSLLQQDSCELCGQKFLGSHFVNLLPS